jgi:tryptophan synthase beta subunit
MIFFKPHPFTRIIISFMSVPVDELQQQVQKQAAKSIGGV